MALRTLDNLQTAVRRSGLETLPRQKYSLDSFSRLSQESTTRVSMKSQNRVFFF